MYKKQLTVIFIEKSIDAYLRSLKKDQPKYFYVI